MKLKERVLEVTELQSGTSEKTGNQWSSRDLVLITDERYPRKIALTFKGMHCQLLDNIKPGDIVEVSFDAESRLVNGRYYTTLYAWQATVVQPAQQQTGAAQTVPAAPAASSQEETY